jgi:hypothetical protein
MRIIRISSSNAKGDLEQQLNKAVEEGTMDSLINRAKLSFDPKQKAYLAVLMSRFPGSLMNQNARMFVYDLVVQAGGRASEDLLNAFAEAVRRRNAMQDNGPQEINKLVQIAAGLGWDSAALFMTDGAPIEAVNAVQARLQFGEHEIIKTHIGLQDEFMSKMKTLQAEGFDWDCNVSGLVVAFAMDKSKLLQQKIFREVGGIHDFKSLPDAIVLPIISTTPRNTGSWRENPAYKAMAMEMKRDSVDTADTMEAFLSSESLSSNPDFIPNMIRSFFDNGSVGFDEKKKVYYKFLGEWNDARRFHHWIVRYPQLAELAAKGFAKAGGKQAYPYVLANFLAGKDTYNVEMLTADLGLALEHSDELYDAIKGYPDLERRANPTFMAIIGAITDETHHEEYADIDAMSTWLDRARIMREAGMLQDISRETQKNLLIGYLLFVAGLPLWAWAAKSGTSENEMRSHPEMRQKAESIYNSADSHTKAELDQLKNQIQREIEERKSKALEGQNKQAPASQPKAFKECEVTPDLVQTIISMEHDPRKGTSSAGAAGEMQLMKPTWDELNKKHFGGKYAWHKYRFNKDVNVMFGTQYLKDIKAFLDANRGEWKADEHSLIMACYFGGMGNVEEAGFNPHVIKNRLPLTYDYMMRGTNLMENSSETLLAFQKTGSVEDPVDPLIYDGLGAI